MGETLLSIGEALALVLGRVQPLPAEDVPLAQAAGRVLAEDARATVDLPPFPASAMDGYAVRSADLPGPLTIVDRSAAGRPASRTLTGGEAIEISTGAVVPDGADTVVPIEHIRESDGTVEGDPTAAGQNVRPRGGDLMEGATVITAGTRLGAAHIGALAAAGIASVRCGRAPRVAVAVTGTELRAPGDPLARGEIYDANGSILETQLRSAGAVVERLPPTEDDAAATRATIERGLYADVLLTTGGVSVGVHDLVRAAEAELGVEEIFWRVSMRPGKPIAFGVRGATLVFGLPGNPVSTLVAFELFVRPALLALQGVAAPAPPFLPGVLGRPTRQVERDSLLRARLRVDGDAVVLDPLVGQESHMIAQTATADTLVLIPSGSGELPAGSAVRYLTL